MTMLCLPSGGLDDDHYGGKIQSTAKESLKGPGLALEPLSVDIMLESAQMGDEAHGDPADRLILTTAKNIRAMIMTADDQMIS